MVNYPHRSRPKTSSTGKRHSKQANFANRGMSFEAAINETNHYYLSQQLAVIHKKPTPVQIVKVDYPMRSRAKIVEAYFRQASTTDYSGVYKGHYVDFEAKETRQKTSMPMKNFHEHQIQHMEDVLIQGGLCFVLLHFSTLRETYLLASTYLITYYREVSGTKSMPLSYIREHGFSITLGTRPQVPYLDILDQHFLNGELT